MTNEVTSIGVGMETDGIERGIKSLKTLAEQGPKVEQAMAGVERVVKTAGKTLEGLRQSAPDLSGVAAGAAKAGAALGGLGNPRLQQMWAALGGDPAQLDDLFHLAVTL